MSELSDILLHTDFEHISLEDLVYLEDSLQKYENTAEKETLAALKLKIADKYAVFNDRFGVHRIRTGYEEEGWGNGHARGLSLEKLDKKTERRLQGWDPNDGWKFHLDVVPNRNYPVTKAISEFLLELGVEHKIAAGGENGKGMTVYVGSYEDINRLAREVQKRFGKDIYEPPAYTDQAKQEHTFEKTVYGRFVPGAEGDYPIDGIGIGYLGNKAALSDLYFYKSVAKAFELGLIKDVNRTVFPTSASHRKRAEAIRKERESVHLLTYCSHKLYIAALGNYYCGTDVDAFEKAFFKDKLPDKETEDRKKWDEVAKVFVDEAKSMNLYSHRCGCRVPLFDYIKSFTNGYIPIDFSRLPSENINAKDKAPVNDQPKKTGEAKTEPLARQQKKTEVKSIPAPRPKKITAEEHIPVPTPKEKADALRNQDFKEPWRKFYRRMAVKEKAGYSEEKDSAHYKATLSRGNGEKLEIIATPQHKVSLMAKDKDGINKIPSYEDFNNLVLAVKEQGGRISFGKIKTPEFRARLLLACLQNDVDMKMLPEFGSMEGLEPETKQRLNKHKIAILKKMSKDKEITGEYSGLSTADKESRQNLEKARQTIRQARKNNQTAAPEYEAAKKMLLQRKLQMSKYS